MSSFAFNTTPSIICGRGCSVKMPSTLGPGLGKRLLIVTDAGLVKLGLLDPILAKFREANHELVVYDGVDADPPESNVMSAVAAAQSINATGVIGIGGGSPMDVAKVAALLLGSKASLGDVYGVGVAQGPRIPLVLVPTTAGTGSEVTPIAILTTGAAEKKGIVSKLLLPDVAVLDAELTLGLPAHITAATGIDAMVHAIEAFSSASTSNNPISRGLARQALQILGANIRDAVSLGTNVAARESMLLGSMLAGQAFANSPVAAVHALAYPIGAQFHVPHGLSNALVLPHVLRFNLDAASSAYCEIAADAFPELLSVTKSDRASRFIESLAALSGELGLPSRLRDVGIPVTALAKLAADAMKQTRLLVNNPRQVTESDALNIYQSAF
ncbi:MULTISPECIES: iron-containing alcohol dehydrogenase [Caballeronia]|uniref:iron-containing alcohol dehydrogenase n=1 Tax=Caballeronia TaxID=1827195 RepID=UPI001FD09BD1|nr:MULTISPECIES: iron-containing alcohol dehydrogenase [Caballeronia]MDR5799156.1 iron-containing alcohol dehydrogenase [Caballeronia sp. LZ001]